ncbi:hypothetical protein Y88_1333 [Novosphingobium nitrogenifigens DSM 19370]|uniref:Uncharacterized protein n=1 Tax=Novosphingobium nitrogenifigens DSM 19370 TaxID=983920 RepID=F1Z7V4_9SPHN|nr:hypothetical protein [Novosphingobium nitrogenifigens]EGD59271.1 hypothetical protein Y88_1333 [Novosphingobium nitrogenifigens DSM 19370]
MARQKRNRTKLCGVTVLWLIGARLTVALASILIVALLVFLQHPHGAAEATKAAQHVALSLAPTLAILAWSVRIAIVILVRKGMLPGTQFPDDSADLVAVFAEPIPAPARRNPSTPSAPAAAVPLTTGPKPFGRRRSLVIEE